VREDVFDLPGGSRTVKGFLVIDRTVAGTSAGGLRMRADVTLGELRMLAEDMSLKYGFLGIPQGGAKGGLAFDPEAPADERRRLFEEYGRAAGRLLRDRTYIPGPDMGTTEADIRIVLQAAGRPPSRIRFSGVGTGTYTGLSVFIAARSALASFGRPVRGATVAIEGFGKVGSSAAAFFSAAGAKVIAVSTKEGAIRGDGGLPVTELVRAAWQGPAFVRHFPGAEGFPPDELQSLPVDVFCPCALAHSVDDGHWPRVRARVVCGGANSPLTENAEKGLHAARTLVVPDFISNCGGVLGTYLEIAGFRPREIERLMPRLLDPAVEELLRASSRKNLPPAEIARRAALRRFDDLKRRTEEGRGAARLFSYRSLRRLRPYLPPLVARAAGLARFRKALRSPVFGDD